jgi:hypothetical protein
MVLSWAFGNLGSMGTNIGVDNQSITIVPGRKGFQPLGLFRDIHSEEYNFSTLFFGHCKTIINRFISKNI